MKAGRDLSSGRVSPRTLKLGVAPSEPMMIGETKDVVMI